MRRARRGSTSPADWLAAGEGGIWLSGESQVYRLDPGSGRRTATIPVRQGPCEASDVGFGAVWTATCKVPGLAKIDPSTNRVVGHVLLAVPVALDGEGSIGAGERGVWIVTDGPGCTGCRVARVDPRTMKVAASIKVQEGSATVRTGEGAVWVANPDNNLVQQIDPGTEKVVRSIKTGPGPRFFDIGEGAVWTLNQIDGSVTRIDPASGEATNVDAGVAGSGGDLTVGGGSVWARGGGYLLLTRIDPSSDSVVERYRPPSAAALSSSATTLFGSPLMTSPPSGACHWRRRSPRRIPLLPGTTASDNRRRRSIRCRAATALRQDRERWRRLRLPLWTTDESQVGLIDHHLSWESSSGRERRRVKAQT